jgi:hypothetical protein
MSVRRPNSNLTLVLLALAACRAQGADLPDPVGFANRVQCYGDGVEEHVAVRSEQEGTVSGRYRTGRTLYNGKNSYIRILGAGWFTRLMRIPGGKVWTDMGAGQMRALFDYYRDRLIPGAFKAKLAALAESVPHDQMTPEYREEFQKFKEESGIQILADGRQVEEYHPSEIPLSWHMTDVAGPITYSRNLHKVLNTYGTRLEKGGWLSSAFFDTWSNEACIRIVDSQGRRIPPRKYLEAIQGMKVLEYRDEWVNSGISVNQFTLERTDGPVVAPPLRLKSYAKATGEPGARGVPQIVYVWDTAPQ